MTVLDEPLHATVGPPSAAELGRWPGIAAPELDEATARRDLRRQIARLEAKLSAAASAGIPHLHVHPPTPRRGGARVLGLGELERVRDDLAERVRAARADASARAAREATYRQLLEHMMLEPSRYPWVRVLNEDLGKPGCKSYHVRPRFGLLGMLMGWWRVKISSGCPLPR